jgi:Domain of unknown function (DUF5658)
MTVKRCVGCSGRIRPKDMGACPKCGREVTPADAFLKQPGWWLMPEMRYQNAYVWLVLVSSLDVMLTIIVLVAKGGFEVNPVAAAVIDTHGFGWAIVFKFAIVVLVVLICEVVGRMHDRSGRKLARAAVAINSLPVVYTFALLLLVG